MTNASIHTLELYAQATFSDFKKLYDFFNSQNAVHKKKSKQITFYDFPYYFNGISRILATPVIDTTTQKCVCVHIRVIANPRYAIPPLHNAASQLIDPDKLGDALEIILNELHSFLPSNIYDSLVLSRVDFTTDLHFKTQADADLYISLIQKGRMIRNLKEQQIFSPTEQKMIHYDDSFLLSCKSYSFQVYPKYWQMLDRNISGAESALGVVRFELRAGKQKLNTILSHHAKISESEIYNKLVSSVHRAPREEIMGCVMLSVGAGDFFTRAEVKQRIINSKLQSRVQEKMLNLVDLLTRYSNVQKLFDHELISCTEWRKLLQYFDRLHCSPITIPASAKCDRMPGVLSWY